MSMSAVSDGSASRSPHGERGLKLRSRRKRSSKSRSLSSRRAWIEIMGLGDLYKSGDVALLTESVD